MTEIPESLQIPAAAGTADNPPLLQQGAADAQGIEVEFDLDNLIDAPVPNFIAIWSKGHLFGALLLCHTYFFVYLVNLLTHGE